MNLRRTFPQKTQKRRQKSLYKKVYKSEGTNTVLSYAFLLTLISQRCFLPIWGAAKYILMDSKTAISWKTEFYLLLNRLCVFFVVVSRELYVKKL